MENIKSEKVKMNNVTLQPAPHQSSKGLQLRGQQTGAASLKRLFRERAVQSVALAHQKGRMGR